MTRIEYYEKGDEISISIAGHAGYDKIGSDIVCSAISILGQTLLAYLDADHEVFSYQMKEGRIWAYASGERVRIALNVIMTGYWLIENNYPDYIRIDRGCSIQKHAPIDNI